MNRISINNVVYESEYSMSIVNNKVVCSGPYTINGKPSEDYKKSVSTEYEDKTISKKYDLTGIQSLVNEFFSITLDINPQNEQEELIVTTNEATHKKMSINFNRSNLLIGANNGSFGEISITLKAKSLYKIFNTGTGDIYGEITAKELTVNNEGTGNISGKIIAKELTINNQGTGNITLQGKAEQLKLNNSGVGNLNTLELLANQVSFDSSGVGNLKCTSKLIKRGSSSGIGNVKYHADEKSNIYQSGLGNIKYLGPKSFDISSVFTEKKEEKIKPDTPKEKNVSFDDIVDSVQKNKDLSNHEKTNDLGNLAKKFKKIL